MDSHLEFNEWFCNVEGSDVIKEGCEQHEVVVEASSPSLKRPAREAQNQPQRESSLIDMDLETGLCGTTKEDEDHSLTETSVDDSSSDLSSLEDSKEFCKEDRTSSTSSSKARHHLTFNKKVEVREYCVTLGDHPICSDCLPLSLDWHHSKAYYSDITHSNHRGRYYQPPRRLSFQDRRKRLKKVADYPEEVLDALTQPAPLRRSLAGRALASLQLLLQINSNNSSLMGQTYKDAMNDAQGDIWSSDDPEDWELVREQQDEKEGMVLVWERNEDFLSSNLDKHEEEGEPNEE